MLQFLAKLLIAMSAALCLQACSPSPLQVLRWREEVLLHNGQVVIAEQQKEFRSDSDGARWGLLSMHHLSIVFPSISPEPIVWEGHVMPISIDVGKDGHAYLVAIAETAEAERFHSMTPGIDHVAFKWNPPVGWQRITVSEIPPEMKPNLMIETDWLMKDGNYQIKKGQSAELITIALKARVDASPAIERRYRGWSYYR